MNINIEREPDCTAVIRIEFPSDTVKTERSQVLKQFAGQVQVPGYRKGKVPEKLLSKRFGKAMDDQVAQNLIRRGVDEIFKKEELELLTQPAVNSMNFQEDGAFEFTSMATLRPEIIVPDYKGIPISLPKFEIAQVNINNELESIRSRFADFSDVEGRPLQLEDYAVLNYDAFIDGKPVDEVIPETSGTLATARDGWIKLKGEEEDFLPNFSPQVVGMNIGEKREITISFPDDHGNAAIRGKDFLYKLELTGIKEQTLPELNDELADRFEKGLTLEGLRERLEKQFRKNYDSYTRDLKEQQLNAFFAKSDDFEIPASLVNQEAQQVINEIVAENQRRNVSQDIIKEAQEEIVKNAKQEASDRLKRAFVLGKISKMENITATDEEINKQVALYAKQTKTTPEKLRKQLEKNNNIATVEHNIKQNKTVEFLLENATITYIDIPQEEDAPSEDAEKAEQPA